MKFPSKRGCGILSVSLFDELICINSVFLRSGNKSVSLTVHCDASAPSSRKLIIFLDMILCLLFTCYLSF